MKTILTVKHANGEQEAICKCGHKMELIDLGESQYIQAGEIVQEDLGYVWRCESCGWTCDE